MEINVDTREFQSTFLTEGAGKDSFNKREEVVAGTVMSYLSKLAQDRQVLEQEWRDCWAEYFSNDRGSEILRQAALSKLGDIDADWRHKVPTGKAFELVETVNSYLQAAFFPNQQWFDIYPKFYMETQEWEDVLSVLTKFILYKLEEGNFRDYWDSFCRQMLVVGTSVLALPWRYETAKTFKNIKKKGKYVPQQVTKVVKNGLDFEVVDLFDFYLDTSSTQPRVGNCIRRLVKTKGEVIRLIESGVYPLGDKKWVNEARAYECPQASTNSRADMRFLNGFSYSPSNLDDKVELFEYWGNLVIDDIEFLDVCVVVMNGHTLMMKPNPYWGGKPFVIGNLVNTHDSPYGTGLVQPVLGQLHTMYICQNHRLDCNELAINPMWLVTNDGSIDLSKLYSRAGNIIPVEDVETSIKPVEISTQSHLSVQDEALLEARVDKITGVGAYVGVNGGRQAERVTAEEIKSQRDAGGNRLGRYHKHIEDTALRDLLLKSYSFMQQFVVDEETIRIQQSVKESMRDRYDFYVVSPDDLQYDLDIVPIGSDHIIDKEYELRQRLDYYTFVSQNPELTKYVNWKEVAKDLARRLIKQDWERFVVIPEEQPEGVASQQEGVASQLEQPDMEEQLMMQQLQQQQQLQNPTGNVDADAYINSLAQNPGQAQQTVSNVVANDRRFTS